MCGSGGKPEDWYPMIDALNIKEDIIFVSEDPNGDWFGNTWLGTSGYEIQDQVAGLEWALANADTTDIKLIGHSEGAAAIITVLDKLANDPGYLGRDLTNELKAAITIEAPTAMIINSRVVGWDEGRYNDLPADLAQVDISVGLLDVWNTSSIIHSVRAMPGWGSSNTYSYSSGWLFGHNQPLTNSNVFKRIQQTIYPLYDPWADYYYDDGLWD